MIPLQKTLQCLNRVSVSDRNSQDENPARMSQVTRTCSHFRDLEKTIESVVIFLNKCRTSRCLPVSLLFEETMFSTWLAVCIESKASELVRASIGVRLVPSTQAFPTA